jgi:hypothetical protein
MTMQAAMVGTDGIVLAGDTRWAWSNPIRWSQVRQFRGTYSRVAERVGQPVDHCPPGLTAAANRRHRRAGRRLRADDSIALCAR